uniref:Uncharacterized protein n=1 Tax=Arundo donax TaxID=35708 RepID=A0A0A9GCT5_ARUDO
MPGTASSRCTSPPPPTDC